MTPKISASNFCALTSAAENCRGKVTWPKVSAHAEYKKSVRNIKVVHSLVIQTIQPSSKDKNLMDQDCCSVLCILVQ